MTAAKTFAFVVRWIVSDNLVKLILQLFQIFLCRNIWQSHFIIARFQFDIFFHDIFNPHLNIFEFSLRF